MAFAWAPEDDRLDRDLVEQAQQGDREAFAILARTHGDRLMAIAQRILRDIGRAEDAVQQALVNAWRELPGLRDPDRFDAWLQRLLVNASYAEARRSRTWNANVRVLPIDGPAGPDETTSLDNRDRLERGFRRLPPDQRAILVFTHYLGLAPTEIAERLGIPVGTANSRLHYAHRAMRAAIEADERSVTVAGGQSR
jgi:RNA polymerase sigma-70 factor, ECF subfamily